MTGHRTAAIRAAVLALACATPAAPGALAQGIEAAPAFTAEQLVALLLSA